MNINEVPLPIFVLSNVSVHFLHPSYLTRSSVDSALILCFLLCFSSVCHEGINFDEYRPFILNFPFGLSCLNFFKHSMAVKKKYIQFVFSKILFGDQKKNALLCPDRFSPILCCRQETFPHRFYSLAAPFFFFPILFLLHSHWKARGGCCSWQRR